MTKNMLPSNSGQAALVTIILVIPITVVLALSINSLVLVNKKTVRDVVGSMQSYYTAEAGIEDSLLRLTDLTMNFQTPNTLSTSFGTTDITITQNSNQYAVESHASVNNRVRKLSTGLRTNTTGSEFFYGVQVGDGGLAIDHNEGQVDGNVYSNGPVSGTGQITGSVAVANNGNTLTNVEVVDDAHVYECVDAVVTGNLTHHVSGSNNGCTVSGTVETTSDEIPPIDFPITSQQISDWKASAESGGVLSGNQVIGSDTTLGPVKIDGNLFIDNNVRVTLTGVVWVTGTFDSGNNAIVELDEGYGSSGGVFIADGNVQLQNNVIMRGSGAEDSYLLVIGASSSTVETSAAMDVKNNLDGAILFTPNGLMVLHNNVNLLEALAYQMLIKKATVTYQQGLADLTFSSGPGGGWDILGWEEIE